MLQIIAPKTLTLNGKPSPCECTEDVLCGFCVQANLILWSRNQEKEIPTLSVVDQISKDGIRKTARSLRVEASTVSRWVRNRRIPNRYKEKLYSEMVESVA